MPELDPDLVVILELGLLGLIVLVLLGVMSSLRRVRKSIEQAAAERSDRWYPSETSSAATPLRSEPVAAAPEEQAPSSVATSSEYTPEPQPVQASSTPSVSDGPGVVVAQTSYEEPAEEPAMATAEQPVVSSQETSPESVETSAAAAEPAASSTSVATSTASEPEEQPFERDGRWWFRRGSELLVYDEGTGQWITSTDEPPPMSAPTETVPTTISSVSGTADAPAEQSPSSEQHGFWKCPSCGAVNGSTATTCRMCFTARP
jgi:hypothetical protein